MLTRRKSSRRLERELANLRHEFDTIYNRMQRLRPATANGNHLLASVAPWLGQGVLGQGLSGSAPDAIRDMTRSASRGAERMSHQLEDVFDMATEAVRKRPLPAGLALLAFGVVLGLATRKAMSA